MSAARTRRIYVPLQLEPEVMDKQGKYVLLEGRTYVVQVERGSSREGMGVAVDLEEAIVPETEELKDITHWLTAREIDRS